MMHPPQKRQRVNIPYPPRNGGGFNQQRFGAGGGGGNNTWDDWSRNVEQRLSTLEAEVGKLRKENNQLRLQQRNQQAQAQNATQAPAPVAAAAGAGKQDTRAPLPTANAPATLTFTAIGEPGFMHLLGTDHGASQYQNPCSAGFVVCEASSVRNGDIAETVDHVFQNQRFFTCNKPNQWVRFELQNYRLKPTYYSFAHRAGTIPFYARTWSLLGSEDGQEWESIRDHVDDATLNPNCLHGAWPVQATKFYRYFCVQLGEKGNDKHTNALVLSCFEVWGDWYWAGDE
eukprot:TRINITY_DN66476_c10_g15_i1.p1 TRINITY_DN66476_c10_g15~~TRINITY_DN66476_c10_g15_i1.p1  ORF type:complete len:286 (-),score=29.14 TRINITY_DN66476_c10_g15_i1:301-1158(-)